MTPLITQSDLEARLGAQRVVELFDDDRDGVADASAVATVLQLASDRAAGILYAAFPGVEQITTLAANDTTVGAAMVDIALGYAGQRRPEFTNQLGESLFWKQMQTGVAVLKDLVKGGSRSIGEVRAGANGAITGRIQRAVPATFLFASSKANPRGGGGF